MKHITSDCHMHTCFSADSDTKPEEMVEGALKKGLSTICFTDHYDKDLYVHGKEMIFNAEEYWTYMTALKEQYKNRIEIRIGMEFGMEPCLGAKCKALAEQYPYDFIIGSTHSVDFKDPAFPDFFAECSGREKCIKMFEQTVKNLQSIEDFDVLGHIDYIVRYTDLKNGGYSYQAFGDYIDAILKEVISRGKGIELNTSGFKYGLGFCHPHPDVIRRYRELGGEIITVGADGHRPEHIAYDFEKVSDILTACGFRYYTEFKDRKPIFRQLL